MNFPRKSPTFFSLKKRNTSPTPHKFHYDVFLSFRGEDTRHTISNDLYNALIDAGIHTFRDDDELPRGNDIPSELIKAIEESRASIVVFSKDYASSRWCLDELVKILECKTTLDQFVFPVFYDVDRCHVLQQTGSFESAFARHDVRFDREKVEKWRAALTEAAGLEGWELYHMESMSEKSEFVNEIVTKVRHKVKPKWFVAKHPVGLDSRIEELRSLIKDGLDNGCIIGIHGIKGIGKTTIVKEFYNTLFRKYEGCCFLTNVGEISKSADGITYLQRQLLLELEGKNYEIGNAYKGIDKIKSKLRCKRVLIVLDGVDELSQLDSLTGHISWFGKGSMIIVTTRSIHVLDQAKVGLRYEVKELNHEESLVLLSWYAFGCPVPFQSYKDLSREVVNYSQRTPMNLELIGSSLVGTTKDEWENMLARLKKNSLILIE
ncbi:disease resistance protein RPV1-like [Helianthus annuus]|uniref:disease resistance protein RPV1-like n=1 Tax=Helianthus annuus TaxID=4232 RepID=UPI000B8FE404|nr:disease resistance protein RPV1-like [Helianthus annuus]